MTITIRQATIKDHKGIEALIHAAFPPHLVGLLTEELQEKLQSNTCYSLVAVDGSTVIGHASIDQLDTPRVHFGRLAVAPNYRQRGIASALTNTRLQHLHRIRFQGTAVSEAVTHHPYSQQSLLRAGFSPIRILLGRLFECSDGIETTVGFVRLFQPPSKTTSLYVPEIYREIASTVLSPFATFRYKDSSSQEISKRIQTISHENLHNPNSLLAVRLYEKTAPAEIAYLAHEGFVIAGFYPAPIHESTFLSAVAHMHKIPTEALDKTKIHIAKPVEPLFDFVWQQYEQRVCV